MIIMLKDEVNLHKPADGKRFEDTDLIMGRREAGMRHCAGGCDCSRLGNTDLRDIQGNFQLPDFKG